MVEPMEICDESKLRPSVIRTLPELEQLESSIDKVLERLREIEDANLPGMEKAEESMEKFFMEVVEPCTSQDTEFNIFGQALLHNSLSKARTHMNAFISDHKGLHSHISRIGKEIDRQIPRDYSHLVKNQRKLNDPSLVLHREVSGLICEQLVSSGHFETARELCEVRGEKGRERAPFDRSIR